MFFFKLVNLHDLMQLLVIGNISFSCWRLPRTNWQQVTVYVFFYFSFGSFNFDKVASLGENENQYVELWRLIAQQFKTWIVLGNIYLVLWLLFSTLLLHCPAINFASWLHNAQIYCSFIIRYQIWFIYIYIYIIFFTF